MIHTPVVALPESVLDSIKKRVDGFGERLAGHLDSHSDMEYTVEDTISRKVF